MQSTAKKRGPAVLITGLKAAPLDFVQKALPHLENSYLSVEQITELETICTYLFSKNINC